ncbi:hypothetical protein Taro_030143 [Colocasia esculenta]|uniref:Uncharacterized protein n=1 Tax=Colocasia esculenta TaxID=4460 RepID=A0A843W2F3_COLES|nr:hypothetical protein [Colocasia esculenta]
MRDRVWTAEEEGGGSRSLTGEEGEGGDVGFAPSPSQGPPWELLLKALPSLSQRANKINLQAENKKEMNGGPQACYISCKKSKEYAGQPGGEMLLGIRERRR